MSTVRNFALMMKRAMHDAENALECAFGTKHHGEDKATSLAYIASCIARCSAARTYYLVNIEELERGDIDEVFGRMDIFTQEALDDYRTNHSLQWVDIQFNELNDAFQRSILAEDFPEDD